ncbi:phytanoyl-CoA dioxygenase family protein [Chitinophaga cymbidii]|uniref:phytanoyl-CoA dioxygenase family protein n=1 Tax=Chitinophaga cymbidii TaxID=1096750 RepID=UPI0011BD82C6|nr:phytanoyl-CoA dioxygenase family protein [Chitinophaga cymbidii]
MAVLTLYKEKFNQDGFTVIENVYSEVELDAILQELNKVDSSRPTFRKSADLFAIRQFLKEVPAVAPLIFTDRLRQMIKSFFGAGYSVVKSIYFDKPGASNWFVSYHQDLTISVNKMVDMEGFGPWTIKQDQFAVQPPLDILEHNFTVRIHLDNTNEQNGALRVIPQSHRKGIYRPETINWSKESETVCAVPKGGIMLMRPLLLHASSRTTNEERRRVIHVEFSNRDLPEPLKWSEMGDVF